MFLFYLPKYNISMVWPYISVHDINTIYNKGVQTFSLRINKANGLNYLQA